MHMCIQIYIYIYAHFYVYTHTFTDLNTCTYTLHIHIHIHIHAYIHMNKQANGRSMACLFWGHAQSLLQDKTVADFQFISMREELEIFSRAEVRHSVQKASLGVLCARYFDVMHCLEQGEFSVDTGRIWLHELFRMRARRRERHVYMWVGRSMYIYIYI